MYLCLIRHPPAPACLQIPGFYQDVRLNTLAAALQRLDGSEEFNLAGYQAALGIPQLLKANTKR